jgi:Inhibitor of growth proteins N-terminal histone-binding
LNGFKPLHTGRQSLDPQKGILIVMMSGGGGENETYLEAFVDQLSSLPHDLRRSLELLKSLDSNVDLSRLKWLQQSYIADVERTMVESLRVVEMPPRSEQDLDYDYDSDDAHDESSSSKKKRVGVILRQEPDPTDANAKTQQGRPFLPTTQELFTFTYNAEMYEEIKALQQLCLQKADEKCAVANQAYEMIDQQIQKLDADMAAIEPFLKVNMYLHILFGSAVISIHHASL